jgi:ribosomal protein L29
MYTIQDLRDMSVAELLSELKETQKTIFSLQLAVKTGKEKNTALLAKNKRYRAQIYTMINWKKLSPSVEVATVKEIKAPRKKSVKKANK